MNEENININNDKTSDLSQGKKRKIIITVIIVIAAFILIAGSAFGMYSAGVFNSNKYNKMGYINISGRTLEEVAEEADMSVEEFKAEYQLPEDMTGDTYESAAFYNIPTGKIAEMYGKEFNDIVELLQLPDTVTETTPWGEAEGEASLKDYVGEESVDAFKEEYGLGDDITGDTKWKEIRNIVDQKALDERLEQEKENKNSQDNDDTDADTADTNGSEISEEELQALIESLQSDSTQTNADTSSSDADTVPADAGTVPADTNTAPAEADTQAAN